MKNIWNGWFRDYSRDYTLTDLKGRIEADPSLVQQLIKEIASYITPTLPRCEDLLANPSTTWTAWSNEANWPEWPDESTERQQFALVYLMKAGTNDPRWWQGHWPKGKKVKPYPNGQAMYIQNAIELLMVDGVKLPEHLLALHGLKPPKVV